MVDFYLETCNEDVLENVTKPFQSLINVGFSGKLRKLGNDAFNPSEMFPKLRKLELNSVEIIDEDSLSVSFPELESLVVRYDFNMKPINANSLIINNPRIRNIRLHSISSSLVDFVSKNLPNLEILDIARITSADYNGDIHFTSVKIFKLESLDAIDLGQITFDQLEEFYCNKNVFPWMDFIGSNTNLKALSLFFTITNEQISLIQQTLPHLVETSFIADEPNRINSIVRFLDASKHLNKLHVTLFRLPNDEFEELKGQIIDNWVVRKNKFDVYVIERRVKN